MDNIIETLKDKIEEIVAKFKSDENLRANFKADPIETIKGLVGSIDLPDGALDNIVDVIKDKLDGNDEDGENKLAGLLNNDKLGGLLDKAKDLLGGKNE